MNDSIFSGNEQQELYFVAPLILSIPSHVSLHICLCGVKSFAKWKYLSRQEKP